MIVLNMGTSVHVGFPSVYCSFSVFVSDLSSTLAL